jgi:hypothetical protein
MIIMILYYHDNIIMIMLSCYHDNVILLSWQGYHFIMITLSCHKVIMIMLYCYNIFSRKIHTHYKVLGLLAEATSLEYKEQVFRKT